VKVTQFKVPTRCSAKNKEITEKSVGIAGKLVEIRMGYLSNTSTGNILVSNFGLDTGYLNQSLACF
jgi:hypothetical protein